MLKREHQLISYIFETLEPVENLHLLAPQHKDRLGVISFYIDDLHYNLGVKLLNDKFGIQTRGGCSCAGTYGHYLLHVDYETSHELTSEISLGELTRKHGWIRMSIHPTTTDEEIQFVCESIKELVRNFKTWASDYDYDKNTNEFIHKTYKGTASAMVNQWFRF